MGGWQKGSPRFQREVPAASDFSEAETTEESAAFLTAAVGLSATPKGRPPKANNEQRIAYSNLET